MELLKLTPQTPLKNLVVRCVEITAMGRLFNFSSSSRLWSFPGNCKDGNNFRLQDQNVGGNNIQSLTDLGFDYGGLVIGF